MQREQQCNFYVLRHILAVQVTCCSQNCCTSMTTLSDGWFSYASPKIKMSWIWVTQDLDLAEAASEAIQCDKSSTWFLAASRGRLEASYCVCRNAGV